MSSNKKLAGLSPDTVDEYIVWVPHILGKLEEKAADLWEEAQEAEKTYKELCATTWLREKTKLRDGKAVTEKVADRLVETDPKCQAAFRNFIKAEAELRRVNGQIRRWKSTDQKIPGEQGLRNQMWQSVNR